LSIYFDELTGNLLGIVHYEQVDESSPNADKADNYPYRIYSIGLAYSQDLGNTWNYLGDIITPYAQSTEASIQNDNDRASKWTCEYNIDGGAYIINPTNDSMYVYYSEAPSFTSNMNYVCYIAFARAKLSDILLHARTNAYTSIQEIGKSIKFPGMFSHRCNLRRRRPGNLAATATGGEGQGSNKAFYCSYAKKYFMITRVWATNALGPSLLLYSSAMV